MHVHHAAGLHHPAAAAPLILHHFCTTHPTSPVCLAQILRGTPDWQRRASAVCGCGGGQRGPHALPQPVAVQAGWVAHGAWLGLAATLLLAAPASGQPAMRSSACFLASGGGWLHHRTCFCLGMGQEAQALVSTCLSTAQAPARAASEAMRSACLASAFICYNLLWLHMCRHRPGRVPR